MVEQIIKSILYYTGAAVWVILAALLLLVVLLMFRQLWDRNIRPSLGNLFFALFGKRRLKLSYYDKWRQIYEKPGLRKFWKKHHNNFGRLAYKRLVYEAYKESRKKGSHK